MTEAKPAEKAAHARRVTCSLQHVASKPAIHRIAGFTVPGVLRKPTLLRKVVMLHRSGLVVALACTPLLAHGYELNPSRTASWVAEATHEGLTLASLACAKAKEGTTQKVDEWNCFPEFLDFAADQDTSWKGAVAGRADPKDAQQVAIQDLIAGVRWPDDPLGRLAANLPLSAGMHFELCEDWLENNYGECGNRFCQTHFGHMQGLHSMKASLPWCAEKGESSQTTCAMAADSTGKTIENWVRWLAPIASGQSGAADLVFTKGSFANVLFDKEACPLVYPADLTLPSLFFVECRNSTILKPWTWGKCPVTPPEDEQRLTTALKTKATGALLHLIQDSFARGHTFRPALSGKDACSARISCTPIAAFNDYSEQASEKHGKADDPPLWDASCFAANRKVDDPITAGAKVLHLLRNGPAKEAEDRVWAYLSKHVFAERAASTDQAAAATKCFAKEPKWKCLSP